MLRRLPLLPPVARRYDPPALLAAGGRYAPHSVCRSNRLVIVYRDGDLAEMQTPAFLALRALVMLATLVAVPMAALFWKSVPSCVDQFLARCEDRLGISLTDPSTWSEGGRARREERRLDLMEAPRFESGPPKAGGHDWAATSAAPQAMPIGPASMLPAASGPPAASSSGEVHASYQEPATGAGRSASRAVPEPPPGGGLSMFGGGSRPSPRTEDQFSLVQRRLKQLGATYYLLESWGVDGTQYRFHCQMAIAGSERYSRQFEVVADDPLAAMSRVLGQVEEWKSGRQP